MKVIIAGGRDFSDYCLLKERCDFFLKEKTDIVIISGMAKGADSPGVLYAKEKNYPLIQLPAEWDKYGKSAGFRRNAVMAEYGDALIAFWNGSKGTEHMISVMKSKGKPVRIVRY